MYTMLVRTEERKPLIVNAHEFSPDLNHSDDNLSSWGLKWVVVK